MKLKSLSELEQLLSGEERKKISAVSNDRQNTSHTGKGATLRVSLETAGRKGKPVTVISGFQHNPDTMKEIARILKQHCGAGGTVKQLTIEIQGDQRNRVKEKLRLMDYTV